MKRLTTLVMFASLAILLAACGGQDPYADPGTPPPPPIEDPTITTSGSISEKPGSSDLMEINVAGFLDPEDGTATTAVDLTPQQRADLRPADFTVVEAGVVKGITVEEIGAGSDADADVVFVFDTTGSMGSALNSVRDSVVSFADHLTSSGLDVQLGAVTFGDAFDTVAAGSATPGTSVWGETPPTFDDYERPTLPLTPSFSDFESFMNFEADDNGPRGGGSGPENTLGALEFAFDEFAWRTGAQRIMIVITDQCSYNADNLGDGITDPWTPGVEASVLDKVRGSATVHVVAPDMVCDPLTDIADFTGATGTGGVFVEWDGSTFELVDLPIASAAGGYIVTFRGTKDGEPKIVRVVIDNGSDIRGEFELEATY